MTDETTSASGEYYLRGIPEMACGFKLEEDHTFQFFLAYGAMDRHGSGTWKEEGGQLVFQSAPWSGKDFVLVESKTIDEDGVTVKVSDANYNVLRYVFASLNKNAEAGWQPADEEGFIRFQTQPVSSISLVFEFCPERFSVFSVDNPASNYFEFRFEPWLAEFFFNDFRLQLTENGLRGAHPMMEGDEFSYDKNS